MAKKTPIDIVKFHQEWHQGTHYCQPICLFAHQHQKCLQLQVDHNNQSLTQFQVLYNDLILYLQKVQKLLLNTSYSMKEEKKTYPSKLLARLIKI